MLKVQAKGRVVLVPDKYFSPFNPTPRPAPTTPGVVHPFAPTFNPKEHIKHK